MTTRELIELKYAEAVKGIKEPWLSSFDERWYGYVLSLSTELKITYLIVTMHNQVFNGGFDQYFVNGYGQFAKETILALLSIGAIRKAEILKEAYDQVSEGYKSDEEFRTNLIRKNVPRLFLTEGLIEILDKLDDQYYDAAGEDIPELLGEYLQQK